MGDLFRGVHLLTQDEYNTLAASEQLDPDVLYATPENVTELVRLHTEQIAQNTSNISTNRNNISNNMADIELLKTTSSGQSSEIVDIKNAISEIVVRDTNQDNRLTNIEENFATKEYVAENGGKIDKIAVNGVDQTISNKRVNLTVPTTTNELTNDSGYITKDVNDLTNYSQTASVGNKIQLNIDSSTYVMTISLLNSSDGVLSTGTVDLPLETVVIGARYADGKLYLTLKDGTELEGIDISAIVSGLVPDTRTINGKDLKQNITISNTDVSAPSTGEFELLENTVNTNGQQITLIKSTLTSHNDRLTALENSGVGDNVVTLDGTQTITGPKTFTEHIYLANADGTIDRISHLNNNFIIHSGATNSSVLNIDEGLEKIYAFNEELAFKSDIAEAAGTTVYVDGTGVASVSFNADPQTQINLLATSIDDNKSDLLDKIDLKVSKSGDTMTGELTASAGVAFGNNKVRAENAGNTFEIVHIENDVDKNVFNYTHGALFTLNNSETPVIIQGLDDRPSYVSGSGIMSDLALESDIPTKVSQLTNDSNYDTVNSVDNKISSNLTTAKSYTDTKIADLIDSAPETRDTLAELAKAIQDNETVVDALNAAIGNKADKTELDNYLQKSGGTLTGEVLTFDGVVFGDYKVLSAGKAGSDFKITHTIDNSNILSYFNETQMTVGDTNVRLDLFGTGTRPNYLDRNDKYTQIALLDDVPTNVSQLTNDSNYANTTDVDAKIATNLNAAKTYTDTAVESLNNAIPKALSQLTADSEHRLVTDDEKTAWNSKLSDYTEVDPTVPAWAKQPNKPEYDYSEIKNAPDCSGIPIGAIITSAIPLEDSRAHLLDGTTVAQTGVYSEFVTYLKSLQSKHPQLFLSEAEWQANYDLFGECGKFVINDEDGTIRFPKITSFIQGTVDLAALGDNQPAGLPNITGAATGTPCESYAGNPSGAFYRGHTGTVGGHTYTTASIGFNAASGETKLDGTIKNDVYGKSDTVQPQSVKYFYYIIVASSVQTEVEVDINNIVTDLNDKLSKSDASVAIKDFHGPAHNSVLLYDGSASTGVSRPLGYDLISSGMRYLYIAFQVSNSYWFGGMIAIASCRRFHTTYDTRLVLSTDSAWAAVHFPADDSFVVSGVGSGVGGRMFIYGIY